MFELSDYYNKDFVFFNVSMNPCKNDKNSGHMMLLHNIVYKDLPKYGNISFNCPWKKVTRAPFTEQHLNLIGHLFFAGVLFYEKFQTKHRFLSKVLTDECVVKFWNTL